MANHGLIHSLVNKRMDVKENVGIMCWRAK